MNGIAERSSSSAPARAGSEQRDSLLVAFDARCILPQEDGLGTYARNLLAQLQRIHSPHRFLVIADPKSSDEIARLVTSDRAEVVYLDAPSMKLSQHWRVPRLLARYHADVYHYPAHDMPVVDSVPSVLSFQDLNFLRYRDYYPKWRLLKRGFSAAVCARSVRAARHILVPSGATRKYLIERWPQIASRISVIPYGVHPRFREHVDEAGCRGVLERYGLAPVGFFLYVGTNRPHKNLARLRAAWLSLSADVRERFRLVLVGSHRYQATTQERGEPDSGIVSLGYVPAEDLPYLYASSFGVVIPSLEEGFGLPALEAMAVGAPVLVSRSTALEEVVGSAGSTFDPYSVDSVRSALLSHASHPEFHEARSRVAKERSAEFDFEETARRTLAIYERVACSLPGGHAEP